MEALLAIAAIALIVIALVAMDRARESSEAAVTRERIARRLQTHVG
jgi:hypothetical protein